LQSGDLVSVGGGALSRIFKELILSAVRVRTGKRHYSLASSIDVIDQGDPSAKGRRTRGTVIKNRSLAD
jgi:hypothetical protein